MINHFHEQMPRPIVGVGHSMGATQLYIHSACDRKCASSHPYSVNLSLIHPRLFTTIISMEPIMTLLVATPPALDQPSMVLGSFFRRDKWPSRDEPITSFRASPAYAKFEPRVFDVFVEYALMDIPPPTSHTTIANDTASVKPAAPSTVTLVTPVLQEVSSYFRYKPIGIPHTSAALDSTIQTSTQTSRTIYPPIGQKQLAFSKTCRTCGRAHVISSAQHHFGQHLQHGRRS